MYRNSIEPGGAATDLPLLLTLTTQQSEDEWGQAGSDSRASVLAGLPKHLAPLNEESLRQFAVLIDALPDAIFLVDRGTMAVTYANQAACLLHCTDRVSMLAMSPWEALNLSREELERIYEALEADMESTAPTEALWLRRNGQPIWIETRRHAQLIAGQRTITSSVRDVTARKTAESRMAYLNRVYAVLSRINALIVRVRDRDELHREACQLIIEDGALAAAWIGTVDPVSNKIVPVAFAGMERGVIDAIMQRLDENPIGSPGGSLASVAIVERQVIVSNDIQRDSAICFAGEYARNGIHSLAIFPLFIADAVAGVLVLYAREEAFFHEEELRLLSKLATDVAFAIDHIDTKERLDYLAHYDAITGLANRVLFLKRTEQYLCSAAKNAHKLALCWFDLERFKNINESLGRSAGDALLRQVALWLTGKSGDANFVARIDADRFAVLMPVLHQADEVSRLLEEYVHVFSMSSFELNGIGYRIDLKIGVALYPDDGGDAEALSENAEAALKKAKISGDRYVFYAHKMTETVVGRLRFENRLRRALELGEYVLYYQPKFELASGKLVGAEALLRWNDPGTGLVSPEKFIPILEETGLIHEVGRWALTTAIGDHLRWRRAGLGAVRIAVNISPLQLQNRDFVANLRNAMSVDIEAASGLELELTETLIMEDVNLSIERLGAIRDAGVRIAIDDFGTGFSSLSYLSKLPVDTVKVDRSFVINMARGPQGMSLISVIINLAHALKLRVVAEGVETPEELRLLRLLGCDEIQGFLLSVPLPAAQFVDTFLKVA
jgi:diguanylate cyclase (GGDEF)-like protein/PAS domain S-box-containing protein